MSVAAGSCQIHLKPDARRQAAMALHPIPGWPTIQPTEELDDYTARHTAHAAKYADELQAREEFTGPHFKDCVAEVNFDEQGWVHVVLVGEYVQGAPGTVYSYPSADVARVKTYRS